MRHGADRLTQGMVAKWGLGLLGALLGNSGGAGTAQAAASLSGRWRVPEDSTANEEREADEVGMMILTRSGWSGRGMVELFEMLGREAGSDESSVDAFLSSHPSPQDRIDNLSAHACRGSRAERATARGIDRSRRTWRGLPASAPEG